MLVGQAAHSGPVGGQLLASRGVQFFASAEAPKLLLICNNIVDAPWALGFLPVWEKHVAGSVRAARQGSHKV